MSSTPSSAERLPAALAGRLRDGGERFAVTGASGWVGLAALDLLHAALGPEAFAERVTAFVGTPRRLDLGGGRAIDALGLDALGEHVAASTVLVHLAFVTREQVADHGADRYVAENVGITARVLDAIAAGTPRGLLYASSGAVHGTGPRLAADLEGDPYGTLKHLDELAFGEACRRAGTRLAVPRIFNLGGPYLRKPKVFALADMIRQAAAGGPVRIKATRPVWRSFVDVRDVVTVCLAWLLAGDEQDAVTFDTAGEQPVEMQGLAERVIAVLGRPDVAIERTLDPDAEPSSYVGDGAALHALAASLGIPLASLDEIVEATARDLLAGGYGDAPA